MVALVCRMPRDLFGAHLELFVSKRLQKPAMEKRDAPRALKALALFLRGPRYRVPELYAAAPAFLPRPAVAKDDAAAGDRSSDEGAPATRGGLRPSAHAFACCMPAFDESPMLFRPDVLVWIREKSFGPGAAHYKCVDLAANARLVADRVELKWLTKLQNSRSPSHVLRLFPSGRDLDVSMKNTLIRSRLC